MFIYTHDKLYFQDGDKFRGVNVSPLGLIETFGKAVTLEIKSYVSLSSSEVRSKFHEGYKFPSTEVKKTEKNKK